MPLTLSVTAGQAHESKSCEPLIQQVLDDWPDVLPRQVAGDKGYSYERVRRFLEERWIEPVIPKRKDQRGPDDADELDRESYRRRNVVERCIGWLKECRAVATRFDKLATNYLGGLYLATIRRYLRIFDSSDSA